MNIKFIDTTNKIIYYKTCTKIILMLFEPFVLVVSINTTIKKLLILICFLAQKTKMSTSFTNV